ncbi:MAG: OmpA family protein [Marinifilaceae bacterium]|jgi:tetratricopeptide (TPR) repeat protein|nr:OmpA family protein [Marinifilaceae bacterium]
MSNIKIYKLFIPFLIIILFANQGVAQKTNPRSKNLYSKALKYYKTNKLNKAEKFLDKILKIDSSFLKVYILKYQIAKRENNIQNQKQALAQIADRNIKFSPSSAYYLADIYFTSSKYKEARKYYNLFINNVLSSNKHYKKALLQIKNCNFIISFLNSESYSKYNHISKVKKIHIIDSLHHNYWPFYNTFQSTLLFTRQNLSGGKDENLWMFNSKDSTYKELPFNSPYLEGSISATADGKHVFFSSNRKYSFGSLDLYVSSFKDGYWTRPMNLGERVNSKNWDSQITVAPNGKSFYFVSNRPGGKGGADIYKCYILKWIDGYRPICSDPILLNINTEFDEMSPYLSSDENILFFSSNGYPGMGGFDFFKSFINNDSLSKPVNLGGFINSSKDELGITFKEDGREVFFASSRDSLLDLYSFKFKKIDKCPIVINRYGDIVSSDSKFPNCSFYLYNREMKSLKKSNQIKDFSLFLNAGFKYSLYVLTKGYSLYVEDISLKDSLFNCRIKKDVNLIKCKKNQNSIIKDIQFEYNSSSLIKSSSLILNLLVEYLKINDNLRFEIAGHTDNIGSKEYNMNLSTARAKTIYEYLINKGISKLRLTFKGYGKSQPISNNNTEAGRAINRRCEIRFLGTFSVSSPY